MSELRNLPSVDQLLQTQQVGELIAVYGHLLTVEALRQVLADLRPQILSGKIKSIPSSDGLAGRAEKVLVTWAAPTLIPVINASGVVLHTNLGRAPLSRAALQAISQTSAGYSTLEFDLERGGRGSRSVHVEGLLTRLTGAEAAFVVNNNAAAVLLALSALANRKRVILSRTQLVEIGGGFRVPEVMSQSGARLVEIGTTNRVHLADYEEALQEPAAGVLHAHPSNFRIIGFTSEPALKAVTDLAHERGVWMMDDLGSGALLDTARFGMAHEPTVQESLAAGVDLVCFSGDKLLGGPQAGILIGRADLIQKIKKHPLARAVRADKLCLAALSATLLHYLKNEAEREIPIWQMISAVPEALKARAEKWQRNLGTGEVIAGESTVGGGSLPGETLPTWLLAIHVSQPNRLMTRLQRCHPPVIARIWEDRVVFDPRTVLFEQEELFLQVLKKTLAETIH